MDAKTAAQIAGTVDFRTVGQSDHEITPEEHDLAVEVGYEMAKNHGIDLAAHVAAQFESEKAWGGAGRGQGRKTADGTTGLRRVNITIDEDSSRVLRAYGDGDFYPSTSLLGLGQMRSKRIQGAV